jgi:zinc D-Ala-D-Ala carboxypeptidase
MEAAVMAIHLPYPVAGVADLVAIPDLYLRTPERRLCRATALAAFARMADAARCEGVGLLIISAYREYAFQEALFLDAERRYGVGLGSRWVAPPGHSEHHTGYVLDLADADFPETDDEPSFGETPAAAWLAVHAPSFGFELSFPEGNPQGVGFEPWHWRFVGDDTAKALFSRDV